MLVTFLIIAIVFVFCPEKGKNMIASQLRSCVKGWKDAFSKEESEQ
jgi:hypothetical protein